MDNKSIEETKKKYEEEVKRLTKLAESTQRFYQQKFDQLTNDRNLLVEEFNHKISEITIGIERVKGAYTALVDIENNSEPSLVVNGMMKDVGVEEDNQKDAGEDIEEDVKDTDKEDVNTDGDKSDISEEVKNKAKEAVAKAIEKDLVTPYKEFAESDLGKETSITPEEMEKLQEIVKESESKSNEPLKEDKDVDPSTVPDYLKEQYGIK